MLKINLFGKIKIKYEDESLEKSLSNKTIALIYLMVANKGRYLAKDKIMFYLWPDSSEDAARYNLRYNLWLLKKVLPVGENGETLIVSEKDCCILNESYQFKCDLITIKEFDFQNASLDEMLHMKGLFCGNIMDGWYLKNCNEFNEMILFDRMMCENRHMELLKSLVSRYESKGELNCAIEILKEMAAIEPDNEEIALRIIETYAALGKRTTAISYYKTFESTLWNSLNITPNEKINSFYKSLYLSKNSNYDDKVQVEFTKQTKEKIRIEGYCMSNIDYFLISNIISNIIHRIKMQYILELNYKYVYDLSYIQREVLIKYEETYLVEGKSNIDKTESNVPSVRVVNGFCKLIELISKYYDIEIYIKRYKCIDTISKGIIEYIQESCIGVLQIIIED